ncbi:MAG: hypothetical protein ABIO04_11965 [Ferruginibacter sp.]
MEIKVEEKFEQQQADNIPEQSTGSSIEPPGTHEPQQLTNIPETKMDVHHHSHTHGRKNWKSYFWEFVMLFLAVFCGFLAEYYLEHTIEKDREKQYMESLLEDLNSDTADIQLAYKLGIQQKELTDSLIGFINNNIVPDNLGNVYLIAANSTRIINVEFESRTASQLKNAGGMRLIRNKKVADSILSYWHDSETCNSISARLERIGEKRHDVSARLFHNKYYIPSNVRLVSALGIKDNAKLITEDPAVMAEYCNWSFAKKMVLSNYLLAMKGINQKAVRLMKVIREGYNLQ